MAEREIDRGERLIFERTREKCSNALIGGWKNRSYFGRQPGRPIKQFDRGLKRRHLGSREIEFS